MSESASAAEPLDAALCILGAGFAGMNALAVASRYLARHDRVVLVDRRARCGGMWNDTYDFVRLHQPHPMFTAGDIAWQTREPPWHLATRPEVLAHFDHCLAELGRRVDLVLRFEHDYAGHEEQAEAVLVHLRGPDGRRVTVRARHLIKTFGFRVPVNPPLALSSSRVHSVAPEDPRLLDAVDADADKPVWVVGGGKSGMDTARAILERFPGREVHLAIGRGTVFMNRDRAFPRGLARWWRGQPSIAVFADVARRFDGDNEADVFDWFKRQHAVYVGAQHAYYVLGLQSEAETDYLASHLASVRNGYVQDVVDDGTVPMLHFDDGQRRALPAGSYVVNCTGYVMREQHAYEPYVSPGGRVVSVQPTSGINILTSFGAWYLTHLLYLDKVHELPLYALDHEGAARCNKQGLAFASMTQLIYNLLLLIDVLPLAAFEQCGLDFNRWYPLPRRLLAIARLRRDREFLLARCRATLDRYRARFDLRGGVLDSIANRGTAPAMGGVDGRAVVFQEPYV